MRATLYCLALDGILYSLGVHDYGASDRNDAFEVLLCQVFIYLFADFCVFLYSFEPDGVMWWVVAAVATWNVGRGEGAYAPPPLLYQVIRLALLDAVRRFVPLCRAAVEEARTDGWRPVHFAVCVGAPHWVVQCLLFAFPKACETTTRCTGMLPLHVAAQYGASLQVVQCLVERYPDALEKPTGNGTLPLHLAVLTNASPAVVQYLIRKCPNTLKGMQGNGWLPLHSAVYGGASVELVDLLVDMYPEALEARTNCGRLPLHVAAECAPVQVVRLLATRGPKALMAKDGNGWLPLHFSVCVASVEVIDCLVDMCQDVLRDARNAGRFDSQEDAVRRATEEMSSRRVSKCPLGFLATATLPEPKSAALLLRAADGRLPLHLAAQHGASEEVIRYLINTCRTALEKKGVKEGLPLHYAVCCGASAAVVKLFISPYVYALRAKTDDGRLPLHLAVQYASKQVIDLLVEMHPGALEMKENDGWLPLHAAARHASEDVVKDFAGRYPKGLEESTNKGWLPLHIAAFSNATLKVVKYLAEACPKAAKMKDSEGRLPLYLAAHFASAEVVQYLRGITPVETTNSAPTACQKSGEGIEMESATSLPADGRPPATRTEESTEEARGADPNTNRVRTREGGGSESASEL
jgi:ankyrin repeat protein